MGVYIKGMEIPESCASCDVACRYYLDRGLDGLLAKICRAESRLPDCPLVPVTSHGRLIDADALKSDGFYTLVCHTGKMPYEYTAMRIDDAPTIIPAEEEQP